MRKLITAIFCLHFLSQGIAQFAGPVGDPSTTAIHKDSSIFVGWATSCKVVRGYMDISNPSLGFASIGDSSKAIGKADGTGVVSLGDGGYAILTFSVPITDGPGWDFAVFENSFNGTFLELAFVEVSSDGINFYRLPAESYLPISPQYDNAANMDCRKINNLAGKYLVNYGTPFDLQELSGIPGLDIQNITHIKIIDVVGSINAQYGTYDKNGTIINDPWPTPFASCGFDLDAVGVIHQKTNSIEEWQSLLNIQIFPNPFAENIFIKNNNSEKIHLTITDMSGQSVLNIESDKSFENIDLSNLPRGEYFALIEIRNNRRSIKLIKE
ncbi:MAG: hypothetical protein KatS3mg027_1111 [Bacteroidia bacterium]|nr:MAG: hypothetical protein KatS3mg027_1111 [Bacteroidia bacterium]